MMVIMMMMMMIEDGKSINAQIKKLTHLFHREISALKRAKSGCFLRVLRVACQVIKTDEVWRGAGGGKVEVGKWGGEMQCGMKKKM